MTEHHVEHNTLCQNESVILNSPPPRSDISIQEIPIKCEKNEASHSMAVEDCANMLNSQDRHKQKYLKESKITVIQDSHLGRVITNVVTNLKGKEMPQSVGAYKTGGDSPMDASGSSSNLIVHFSDTDDADMFVSIIWLTND
jgi:hypothetical protein